MRVPYAVKIRRKGILMIFLLARPVFAAVALAHRFLQMYAPTNRLVRRVRMAAPRFRTAVGMLAAAAVLLIAMHMVAEAVAAGAPGWLNLVVLILAWDAIKLALLGLRTLLLWAGSLVRPKRSHDLGDDEFGGLVLPNPNHSPSGLAEQLVGVGVPLPVVSDLVGPERRIGLRDRVMFWTAVPETAVDEHGDLRAREYKVRPPVQRRDRTDVDAISQARSMCGPPDSELGLRVAPAVRLHPAPDAWR
jgi:hypothetical protein